MHSESTIPRPIRRDRLVITSCIALVTAIAWAYLVHLDNQMSSSAVPETVMAKMGMAIDRPWGAPDVFFTFLMWGVMMIGMMSATAAPVLLLFSGMHTRQGQNGIPLAVPLFALATSPSGWVSALSRHSRNGRCTRARFCHQAWP